MEKAQDIALPLRQDQGHDNFFNAIDQTKDNGKPQRLIVVKAK
jgi:hypothetical protein